MNNFTVATEATATAMDSAGSATKENEIYLQSIEGRMKSLQATMDGFWTTLIDSDLVKSGVDLLQALANALVGLQDTFGSTGATLITLTTAFGLFTDNPLKSFAKTIAESENPTKTFVEGLKDLFKATNETSSGMTKGVASAKGLASAFTEAGAKALLTKASVVALEVAMSALTGVLLSLAVSGIGMLIDQLFNADKRMAEAKQSAQDLANALQNVNNTKATMSEYAEVSRSLEVGIVEEEKRLELLARQKELKEQLAMSSEEASVIMANDNLSYERQLELLDNINRKKLEEKALDLDKAYRNGLFEQDQQKVVENYKRGIEENIKSLEKLQELQKQSNGETIKDGGFTYTAEQLQKGIDDLKQKISDSLAEIDSYNSGVELMKETNIDTERTTVSLSDKIKEYLETLKQSTDALEENTKAKEENANAGGTSVNVEDLTQAYSDSLSSLQNTYDLLKDINDEGKLTPTLVSQVAKMFPQIGSRLTDVAQVQQYLNERIAEQKEIANDAYLALLRSDEDFYEQKLLNDENWLNNFIENINEGNNAQIDGYNIDLSNFKDYILNKASMNDVTIDALATWLHNLIGGNKEAYRTDIANTKNWASTKAQIIKKLDEQIDKITDRMDVVEQRYATYTSRDSDGNLNDPTGTKTLEAEKSYLFLKNLQDKLNQAKEEIETDFSSFGLQLSDWENSLKQVGSSIAGYGVGDKSNSNKGSSSNKEKEKSEYKATLEQWYTLKDAIEDVNNQIEQNQILRARAEGTAKEQEYIKKEVELLKKQIDLKKQLQKEMEKERNNLKSYLMSQGGVFNGENLTNYEKLLGWTATTDEGKEKLQQLEEAVKSYTDLCNSEIPNVKKEWEGLQDQIDELLGTYEKYKVDTEKWFALKDQINDVSVAIERYEYLRNKTTSDKREQEYIQKEIELLQQQITLKKRLQAEMEKEKNQLKALIEASGGKFKGNNLTNYDALFGQEAVGKEAVEKLKELEEAFNRYMELTNSELPSIVMEWEKLQDQIEEVKNSQEKYTASVEKWYKLKDAIEDVNNELELNKIKQEQAVGKDKIELMNKEIALYNKQIELNKQLQKEMEKEKEELKKFIKESGGIFQGDNLINYDDLFGKEVVGSEAVEALKKLEEAVKSYTDLCNSEIPSIVGKWESLNQEIEKVKQQQVDMAIDFEKDLYDVLAYYAKKENDLRKKDIENEKKAVEEKKKLLEERKKLLQETFDKEDREDALAEAQQTLAELDAQIQEALRSGDRELVKRLREQYAEAQKSLNEQIRDQERENALDQFDDIAESYDKEIEDLDDLIEELDKKLEEYLDPMNISKVIASAMNSGFVDIMGQTVEVNKVMSDFLKETTTGVYTTKEALKELEEQLKNIGAVASQLPGISDSLGLPDYSSSLNSRSAEIKTSQLVLNSPLVNIESLDNNSIAEFNEIMNDKINWLIGQINDKFNY